MELYVAVWGPLHYQPYFPSEQLVPGPTGPPLFLVAITVQGQVERSTGTAFDSTALPFVALSWPTFGNGEGPSPPSPSSDPLLEVQVHVVGLVQFPSTGGTLSRD